MRKNKIVPSDEPLNTELVNQTIDYLDQYIDRFSDRITEPNAAYYSAPIAENYLKEMREADYQAWLRTMKAYFLRLHEWFICSRYFKRNQDTNQLAAHFCDRLAPLNQPTIEDFEKELCYQISKWCVGTLSEKK